MDRMGLPYPSIQKIPGCKQSGSARHHGRTRRHHNGRNYRTVACANCLKELAQYRPISFAPIIQCACSVKALAQTPRLMHLPIGALSAHSPHKRTDPHRSYTVHFVQNCADRKATQLTSDRETGSQGLYSARAIEDDHPRDLIPAKHGKDRHLDSFLFLSGSRRPR
jgi:hypothetical protein